MTGSPKGGWRNIISSEANCCRDWPMSIFGRKGRLWRSVVAAAGIWGFSIRVVFPPRVLDASKGLLAECRRHSPGYNYIWDGLPLLAKVESGSFCNVYSSAVLMHLKRADISVAMENIVRVMRAEGVFVFSYRHSLGEGEREEDGRLFTFIDPLWLRGVMEEMGLEILFYEAEEGSNGKKFLAPFLQSGKWPDSRF